MKNTEHYNEQQKENSTRITNWGNPILPYPFLLSWTAWLTEVWGVGLWLLQEATISKQTSAHFPLQSLPAVAEAQ